MRLFIRLFIRYEYSFLLLSPPPFFSRASPSSWDWLTSQPTYTSPDIVQNARDWSERQNKDSQHTHKNHWYVILRIELHFVSSFFMSRFLTTCSNSFLQKEIKEIKELRAKVAKLVSKLQEEAEQRQVGQRDGNYLLRDVIRSWDWRVMLP